MVFGHGGNSPRPRLRPLGGRLASRLQRDGTLGKLRLSPIAEVLRTKAKVEQAEQPESAVAGQVSEFSVAAARVAIAVRAQAAEKTV